ncbi:FAD dependent oxidoreductase (plasmid) [Gemmatirosa kalamazoonensis]|uniref:FAD dependent oxidoreductase n=1 Tax=Gemmatirosa kalamazoonensis TaxID=861299 RepID=W0RT80_9BACT|nr:FAD/NAD(P)-binding protein [Gemmatirosa kalamazoonensis]AHG92778.1 FAD dependent oxidoreductase [Gemmatirosa kalamazoonensis]
MSAYDGRGDDRLGMHEPISRRDFVNGTLAAGAGMLLPNVLSMPLADDDWTGYGGVGDYARSNGNTYEVMSAAHAMRDGRYERSIASAVDTGETYDLAIVGGGISGLAAAVFFQKREGGRCLVLDNHPMFGGEAKRNEFLVDGQRVVAHQGSAIFLVPGKGGYTESFYDTIGMDRRAFEYQRWRGPDPEMPLAKSPYDQPRNYGFYFGPGFGVKPGVWVLDPWGRKLEGAPLSDAAKADLLRWRTVRDGGPRPKTEGDAISRQLDTITLEDLLIQRHGISRETVRTFLSPVEGGGYGLGPDALSGYCAYAIETEFPEDGDDALGDQMFPDGNAGFARLMVKTLVPEAFDGPRTVEAVWHDRVRFAALDRAGRPTRIRLGATVVRVQHAGDPTSASHVALTYAKGGRLFRVRARKVVMAGGSWTTKHVVHDLPQSHRDAYAQFYRSPCLMANVAVRNWRFLYRMGMTGCRWFGGLGDYLAVRKMPTLVGTDTFGPDSPTALTIKVLFARPGLPIGEQGSRGRAELFATSFAQYERAFREQLGDMFSAGGFDPRRDIAGIILNRWGHAYVNPQPGFFFGVDGKPAPRDVLRDRPHGRIAFANTDLAGAADHRNSIREADRAVRQLAGA